MDDLKQRINELSNEIDQAFRVLDIEEKKIELLETEKSLSDPNVWSDNKEAQMLAKKKSKLENLINPWVELQKETNEISGFLDLNDTSLSDEIENKLNKANDHYIKLKQQLKLNEKYDQYDAIVTIQAGAGGTDAMDWAQILQRMYSRWAEKNDIKAELLQESAGEEAGIKSATMSFSGSYAYGKLKSEHGVHRLVRQSPFNTAGSRETSFAMVEVVPAIDESDEINIDDKDIRIDTFRASGHGGQSVNKTDSAVRLTHLPTGIVISMQNEKSQIQNREVAMRILRSKLAQLANEQHQEELSKLKGPNQEAAWGNQIRNYILHPYKLVKDTRTNLEKTDVEAILDGDIDDFIDSYLESTIGENA